MDHAIEKKMCGTVSVILKRRGCRERVLKLESQVTYTTLGKCSVYLHEIRACARDEPYAITYLEELICIIRRFEPIC